MKNARLEHANIVVRDVDAMIQFLRTAFPEFLVRWDEARPDGSRWAHVGTDETYISLDLATRPEEPSRPAYSGIPGFNHLAYVVDDVDGLHERMCAAGYKDSTVPNSHPHRKRVYFHDPDGNDWEFIEYFSTDPAERNEYELAG